MKITRLLFYILLAVFVSVVGCTEKPVSVPLAGWKVDVHEQPSQAVMKDYQDYIQTLPPNEKNYIGPFSYLEDGTGQHAIDVEIFVKGEYASWHYAIIYDKHDTRVKVVRYGYAKYHSM
jgi:hypothetical protein